MFGWIYIDDRGEESGGSRLFADLTAAEDWIGLSWQGLREYGITEVALHDHVKDARVYRVGLQMSEMG